MQRRARPNDTRSLCAPLALTLALVLPRAALALDFYVDDQSGDDARPALLAQSPSLPWKTISHALATVPAAGGQHTIHVAAGTYAENLESGSTGVTLRGTSGTVIIPPATSPGLYIDHEDFILEAIEIRGGIHGIRADGAHRLVIRDCLVTGANNNGIHVTDSDDVQIENSQFSENGSRGILILRGADAYLRNNLVTENTEFGIEIDGGDADRFAATSGHMVAFNTVAGNGATGSDGGIRFENATGEIRDNLVLSNSERGIKTDTAPTLLHHNLIWGQTLTIDSDSEAAPEAWNNVLEDPLLAGGGDYRVAPGSPALDAGSGDVSALDISGSIRTDLLADTAIADIGFHVGAAASSGRPPVASPPTPTPTPAPGTDVFVDCATGDDSRSLSTATNPETPWRTIRHAAFQTDTGSTITVAPGSCAPIGEIDIDNAAVTVRAASPGSVTVIGVPGTTVFNLQADGILLDGFVIETDHRGVLAAHSDSDIPLVDLVVRRLVIRPPPGEGIAVDGITVKRGNRITIDSNRIHGASGRAVHLRWTANAYVRNNLITGGDAAGASSSIDFENDPNTTSTLPPLSSGNIVAFNTLYGNARGIRFNNAEGEIHDNIVAGSSFVGIRITDAGASSRVHHNDSWNNGTNYSLPAGFDLWSSNQSVDPVFVDAAGGDFSLSQVAAGDSSDSPLIDQGSAPIGVADITGSTRSDLLPDAGIADPGFHAHATSASAYDGDPPTPEPASDEVFVDCEHGNDGHSRWEASRPWDAWATLQFALSAVVAGETITVRDGTCTEALDIETPDLAVRSETVGGATITAPPGEVAVRVEADRISLSGLVIQSTKEGVRVAAENSDDSLTGVRLHALRIEPPPGSSAIATNGIRLRNTFSSIVDSCEIRNPAQTGISVIIDEIDDAPGGGNSYLRNNLVSGAGEWGIHIDAEALEAEINPPVSSPNHIVAFNTIVDNGTNAGQGGLRFQNATGEIRDNIVANNSGRGIKMDKAPVLLHHNLVHGNPTSYDTEESEDPTSWNNIARDPLFVDAHSAVFSLRQAAAGDPETSPAVDAGSTATALGLISGSTRLDEVTDSGTADLGFHAGAAAATAIPPLTTPPADTSLTYFVDATTGEDTRHRLEATDSASPWQTISHAVRASAARPGDTVIVQPGTFAESVDTGAPGISIIAAGNVILQPPEGGIGFQIEHPDTLVEGFRVEGGVHSVRIESADRTTVRNLQSTNASSTGIKILDSADAVLDGNRIDGAGARGIHATGTPNLYIRNNLITGAGTWGAHLEATPSGPATTGALVAFNTIHTTGSGGVRFENVVGTIRDNLIVSTGALGIKTDTAPVEIHHNGLFGVPKFFDEESDQESLRWSNISMDPLFVDAASGDYRLQSLAAGDSADSPALNRGSADADAPEADISGSTTRDSAADIGTADLGRHEGAAASPAPPSVSVPYDVQPRSGMRFYVSPSGDNSSSSGMATAPEGAWQTISFAVGQLAPGDMLILLGGDYSETFNIPTDTIEITGEESLGEVRLLPNAGSVGIGIDGRDGVGIRDLVIEGGAQSIKAVATNGLRIVGVASIGAEAVGIQVQDSSDTWIDSSIVNGAGDEGVLLLRSDQLYIRNNLIYGNGGWGISLDNDPGAEIPPATSTGNVLAFNTVYGNGDGIRVLGASAEIRDNIITNHLDLGLYLAGPDIYAHHNVFAFNNRDRDRESEFESIFFWSYIGRSPKFVDPDGPDDQLGGAGWRDDDFHLSRKSAGEMIDSPIVDRGSNTVDLLDIDGSTSSDETPDTGVADPGFHSSASPATLVPQVDDFDLSALLQTYYVSASLGDDGTLEEPRTTTTARDPATPWATIAYAISRAEAGSTIVVLPGLYSESLQVERPDITIRAEKPGSAVVAPLAVDETFLPHEASDRSATGFLVEGANFTLDGLVVRGGTSGISALESANGLRVTNCVVYDSQSDGIRVQDADDITIENSVTTTNLYSGIKLRRVERATIRNVLSYGNAEWGVTFENTNTGQPLPPSTGNLIASNTIAWNGLGNLRFENASGTIRENLLTHTDGIGLKLEDASVLLLANGLFEAATPISPEAALFCELCTGNSWTEPRYIEPAGADGVLGSLGWRDDDFRLAQIGAGQTEQSGAVDAGAAETLVVGLTGSTATDDSADLGMVDLGFHYRNGERSLARPTWTAENAMVLYVDSSTGDDNRSREEARVSTTPWKTLDHALRNLIAGDTLVLGAGTWTEPLDIRTREITILGTGSLGTTTLAPGNQRDAIRVRAVGVEIRNLLIDGGRHGLSLYRRAQNTLVRDVVVANAQRDGIVIRGATGARIETVTVTGCGRSGIYATRAENVLIRNAQITACHRSGVTVSGTHGSLEFSTIHGAGLTGVEVRRSPSFAVRDSIVTHHSRSGIRARARSGEEPIIEYVLLGGNETDLIPVDLPLGPGMLLNSDPLYVDADGSDDILGGTGWADDLLFLTTGSPAIDNGSGSAGDRGVDGVSTQAAGGLPDSEQADLGAHR